MFGCSYTEARESGIECQVGLVSNPPFATEVHRTPYWSTTVDCPWGRTPITITPLPFAAYFELDAPLVQVVYKAPTSFHHPDWETWVRVTEDLVQRISRDIWLRGNSDERRVLIGGLRAALIVQSDW